MHMSIVHIIFQEKFFILPIELTMNKPSRKPTNLSICSSLLAEAKELNINMSRAAENGVKVAVLEAKSKLWIEENFDAIESSNAHVEKHGLPLDKYRCF